MILRTSVQTIFENLIKQTLSTTKTSLFLVTSLKLTIQTSPTNVLPYIIPPPIPHPKSDCTPPINNSVHPVIEPSDLNVPAYLIARPWNQFPAGPHCVLSRTAHTPRASLSALAQRTRTLSALTAFAVVKS